MKILKLRFMALAVTLLFQTSITRADDHAKAVPPSNQFVVLLEGTFQPPGVVPDLGLMMPNLNNGLYKTVPMYNIESGVPSPTDEAVGNFYALGGEMLFVYDLIKGDDGHDDTWYLGHRKDLGWSRWGLHHWNLRAGHPGGDRNLSVFRGWSYPHGGCPASYRHRAFR